MLANSTMSVPGRQIRAIHTIAQQFTALQLAQGLQLARCAAGLAGWLPATPQRLRRALHTRSSTASSWCNDPVNCSSPRRPFATRGVAALRWQCHHRMARVCDRPPFISSPRIPSRLQTTTSRVVRGRPTTIQIASRGAISRLATVETLGQSGKGSRHNRERTLSERWPSLACRHRLFDFRIARSTRAALSRRRRSSQTLHYTPFALECGHSSERDYSCLARANRCRTRVLDTGFYNTADRRQLGERLRNASTRPNAASAGPCSQWGKPLPMPSRRLCNIALYSWSRHTRRSPHIGTTTHGHFPVRST